MPGNADRLGQLVSEHLEGFDYLIRVDLVADLDAEKHLLEHFTRQSSLENGLGGGDDDARIGLGEEPKGSDPVGKGGRFR